MSHMKRACKRKSMFSKKPAPKHYAKSENKLNDLLSSKNIKVFSLISLCMATLGISLSFYLSGQITASNNMQSDVTTTTTYFSPPATTTTEIFEQESTTVFSAESTVIPSIIETEFNQTVISSTSTTTTQTTSALSTTSVINESNYTPPKYINENSAPEDVVYSDNGYTIDASNILQGYIGVKQSEEHFITKVKIVKNDEIYYYDLKSQNTYEFLPLQMGNGNYQISFLEHSFSNRYRAMFTKDLDVSLNSSFIPFLYPNQYVNYDSDSYSTSKSMELCKDSKSEFQSLQSIYNYIIENFNFDYSRLNDVSSDYIPDIDKVLKSGEATCFDYATSLTAMLRAQNIPTKLVIGTAEPNGVNHAWVKVYMDEEGDLAPDLHISKGWNIVDPTFASSGEENIEAYISDSSNYNGQRVY